LADLVRERVEGEKGRWSEGEKKNENERKGEG
jgi:hypothetical protein